jgi:hypothetical protein
MAFTHSLNPCVLLNALFFGWQHIYDFMLVHLTVKFKYDCSKVKINQILTEYLPRKRISRQLFDK